MGNLYSNKLIGYGYDILASLVWFPSKNRLYDECVKRSNIKKHDTALEIGCGTGFLSIFTDYLWGDSPLINRKTERL